MYDNSRLMYSMNVKNPESVAHIWVLGDTVCRMYSTNGLNKKKQQRFDSPQGRKICTLCEGVYKKQYSPNAPQFSSTYTNEIAIAIEKMQIALDNLKRVI